VSASMHISFSFLVSHCQHHLSTVFSDLHTFTDLLHFAHIISVFSSLLSWRNSMPCSISRNIKKKSHHYSIHTNQAHEQQCCKYLSEVQQSAFIFVYFIFTLLITRSHPSLLHPAHSITSPYPHITCLCLITGPVCYITACWCPGICVLPILMLPQLLQQSATSAGLE